MRVDDPAGPVDRLWATGERTCCCPAGPVVAAVMPPTSGLSHPVDLLLCGHQYRASRGALAVAGAIVLDQTGAIVANGRK